MGLSAGAAGLIGEAGEIGDESDADGEAAPPGRAPTGNLEMLADPEFVRILDRVGGRDVALLHAVFLRDGRKFFVGLDDMQEMIIPARVIDAVLGGDPGVRRRRSGGSGVAGFAGRPGAAA